MDIEITITSYTPEVLAALDNAIARALEAIGGQAEAHARDILIQARRVDTGRLQTSITHQEGEDFTAIGTALNYAIWSEIGTGIYASKGGGRQTPWFFKGRDGKWHPTRGIKPLHFLQRAVEENVDEYRRIIQNSLENA